MQNKKFKQVQLLTRQFEAQADNAAFDRQSRCICDLFARCAQARGAQLPDAWGLVAEYRGPITRIVRGDGRIAHVEQPDDVTGVMALPDSERKRAFLHLILRTLDIFFEGRTPRPFLDAAADVRAADFVNAWTWPPGSLRSPDRRWHSVVTVLHDLREWQLRLELVDSRAMPVFEHVLVRDDRPLEELIQARLGALRWEGPRRLVLESQRRLLPPIVVDLPESLG